MANCCCSDVDDDGDNDYDLDEGLKVDADDGHGHGHIHGTVAPSPTPDIVAWLLEAMAAEMGHKDDDDCEGVILDSMDGIPGVEIKVDIEKKEFKEDGDEDGWETLVE